MEGEITKWRVENSWGKDRGDEGYYTMANKWFDEYLYQIVAPKVRSDGEAMPTYHHCQYRVAPHFVHFRSLATLYRLVCFSVPLFLLQAMVAELVHVADETIRELPPWDPMGALAQ